MRRNWKTAVLAATAFALASSGVRAADPPAPASAAVRKAADDYWQFLVRESVTIRTREGLPVDRLPDLSLSPTRKPTPRSASRSSPPSLRSRRAR